MGDHQRFQPEQSFFRESIILCSCCEAPLAVSLIYLAVFLCRKEHWKLLGNLKTTVEGLVSISNPNVWSKYGGLERLCRDMHSILYHGLIHDKVWLCPASTTVCLSVCLSWPQCLSQAGAVAHFCAHSKVGTALVTGWEGSDPSRD